MGRIIGCILYACISVPVAIGHAQAVFLLTVYVMLELYYVKYLFAYVSRCVFHITGLYIHDSMILLQKKKVCVLGVGGIFLHKISTGFFGRKSKFNNKAKSLAIKQAMPPL